MMIREGPCPHISNWIGSPDHRQSNAIPSVAKIGVVYVRFVVGSRENENIGIGSE